MEAREEGIRGHETGMRHMIKGEDITTSKGRTEKRVNVPEKRLQQQLVLYCSLHEKN